MATRPQELVLLLARDALPTGSYERDLKLVKMKLPHFEALPHKRARWYDGLRLTGRRGDRGILLVPYSATRLGVFCILSV